VSILRFITSSRISWCTVPLRFTISTAHLPFGKVAHMVQVALGVRLEVELVLVLLRLQEIAPSRGHAAPLC